MTGLNGEASTGTGIGIGTGRGPGRAAAVALANPGPGPLLLESGVSVLTTGEVTAVDRDQRVG